MTIWEVAKLEYRVLRSISYFEMGKRFTWQYGFLGAGIYGGLYLGAGVLGYGLATASNNWGLDPMAILESVSMRGMAERLFSLEPGVPLSSNVTSMLLGWMVAEFSEPLRLPMAVVLVPYAYYSMHGHLPLTDKQQKALKAALEATEGSAAAGDGSATDNSGAGSADQFRKLQEEVNAKKQQAAKQ